MKKTIHDMEIKLAAVTDKVEDNEVYNRRDNLINKGLPESMFAKAVSQPGTDARTTNVGENSDYTLTTVLPFFTNSLFVDVCASDISVTYRLQKSQSDNDLPIIVKFNNRRAMDKVYDARRKLGKNQRDGTNDSFTTPQSERKEIYVHEHLTLRTSQAGIPALRKLPCGVACRYTGGTICQCQASHAVYWLCFLKHTGTRMPES